MTIEIRPITLPDAAGFNRALDEVARERIYLRLLEAPPLKSSIDFVAHNLARGNSQFVAVTDGSVIGWCDICREDGRGSDHVGSLGMGIVRRFRGQGIGRQLLQSTLAHAAQRFHRVELEVYRSNEAAIALYQKAGFNHEGARRDAIRFDDAYEDILMMSRLFD